jgi:uncharacterized protein (TIGR00730 family)
MIKTLCVYCGGADPVLPEFEQIAHALGSLMAKNEFDLVYGGGRYGMMGALADSLLKNGGKGTGIVPEILRDLEGPMPGLTETFIVDTMHTRKKMMAKKADAFVILPGGYGTLDEFFEIVTWRKLGIHNKPIFIINPNHYWAPLLALIRHITDCGFTKPDFDELVHVFNNPQELITHLIEINHA